MTYGLRFSVDASLLSCQPSLDLYAGNDDWFQIFTSMLQVCQRRAYSELVHGSTFECCPVAVRSTPP